VNMPCTDPNHRLARKRYIVHLQFPACRNPETCSQCLEVVEVCTACVERESMERTQTLAATAVPSLLGPGPDAIRLVTKGG
jgi:hypothetical protein